jgi:DNA polymerase elongation subunit (family B)
MGESESKIFHYLLTRIKKFGLNLQFGREVSANDLNLKRRVSSWIKGRICLESSDGGGRINVTQQPALDSFGFAGLIERSRFGFLPLGMAARYSINRLIDSRNCYELIQRGFVISKKNYASNNNSHERIRTLEELVSRDKGGMIIYPQIGLHENVVSLEYDSEYANLIVNHKLSYETINLKQEKGVVVTQQSNDIKKGLLPTAVEKFLKRRLYFETLKRAFKREHGISLVRAAS